ncbi:uncharacterized protein LOC143019550 isoform X2 [Oratosquilla oratoria]|uniref:uncharacterized protein LOC143019550 isoform X2 n=1 Tax=Oratosquilla oratoria TaxID=337810 RepID=UPI003F75CC60
MTSLARRNSSIHKVREWNLNKVCLEDEYEVLHVLQEGWHGKILLVEHTATRHEVVLKAVHRDATTRLDFFREFHYNYYLSPHRNILNAYDVAFQAGDYYMFAQEFAPFGDLTSNITEVGIGETHSKKLAMQLASALDFMHSKDLVHRDINMDNILIFKSDFSKIKLCDFGSTRRKNALIKKRNVWLPYAPPEVVDTVQNEGYHVDTSQDVWQMGILIYVCLTGSLPWQKADLTDPHYAEYINWRKRRTLRTPKRLVNFTPRFLRMLKRLLEPKAEKRSGVKEVYKYLDDKWLTKVPKLSDADADHQSVCYSTYSYHSSKLEKDRVHRVLKAHGIETTVDRNAKKQRINEWLECTLSSRGIIEVEDDDDIRGQADQDDSAFHGDDGRLRRGGSDRGRRGREEEGRGEGGGGIGSGGGGGGGRLKPDVVVRHGSDTTSTSDQSRSLSSPAPSSSAASSSMISSSMTSPSSLASSPSSPSSPKSSDPSGGGGATARSPEDKDKEEPLRFFFHSQTLQQQQQHLAQQFHQQHYLHHHHLQQQQQQQHLQPQQTLQQHPQQQHSQNHQQLQQQYHLPPPQQNPTREYQHQHQQQLHHNYQQQHPQQLQQQQSHHPQLQNHAHPQAHLQQQSHFPAKPSPTKLSPTPIKVTPPPSGNGARIRSVPRQFSEETESLSDTSVVSVLHVLKEPGSSSLPPASR